MTATTVTMIMDVIVMILTDKSSSKFCTKADAGTRRMKDWTYVWLADYLKHHSPLTKDQKSLFLGLISFSYGENSTR